MKTLRVSLLVNNLRLHTATIDFLKKKGFSASAFTDAKLAISDWTENKPDFVLISWNIKSANPKKLADLAEKTLGLKCIGIAEESDARTAASLVNSAIDEIIHAPISGPVVFMRLQKLSKELKAEGNSFEVKTTQRNTANWEPAVFDKKDPREVKLEQLEKLSMSSFTKAILNEERKAFATTECVALEVHDSSLFGYIVVASPATDRSIIDQTNSFKIRLQDALLMFGRGLQLSAAHHVKAKVDDFHKWANYSGEFVCDGKLGAETLSAFFLESHSEKPSLEHVNDFVGLPADSLIAGEIVNFSIFIHLPVNDRMLKLFKQNTAVEKKRLELLQDQGVKKLFVKKEDARFLDHYLAETQIKKTIKEFQSQSATV